MTCEALWFRAFCRSCTELARNKETTLITTNLGPEEFDLCFTSPKQFGLARSLVLVQSSHVSKKYFDNFTSSSPEHFELNVCEFSYYAGRVHGKKCDGSSFFFQYSLPDLDNPTSEYLDSFLEWLRDQRPYHAAMQVVRYDISICLEFRFQWNDDDNLSCRSDSREHYLFMQYLRLDKTESSMSFQEFLQHVNQQLR